MASDILYVKAKQNVEVMSDSVYLKDVASVTGTNKSVLAKAKAMQVHHFRSEQGGRTVISIVKLIEEIQKIDPNISVESVGETDIVVKQVKTDQKKGFLVTAKIVFVALISFFGTAFTIMAFHNDIGIQEVFAEFHQIVMGRSSDGFTVLEVSYSIGLAVGIILFFNHIGGRRITKDPTPIEVAMREYEQDVNMTLVQTAEREGKEQEP
ncbi:MAG: stage V sporulation protein AA [Clostridiales bacterium]|nr:stage V sporulation protein AA [Clostridiales bacterium]